MVFVIFEEKAGQAFGLIEGIGSLGIATSSCISAQFFQLLGPSGPFLFFMTCQAVLVVMAFNFLNE